MSSTHSHDQYDTGPAPQVVNTPSEIMSGMPDSSLSSSSSPSVSVHPLMNSPSTPSPFDYVVTMNNHNIHNSHSLTNTPTSVVSPGDKSLEMPHSMSHNSISTDGGRPSLDLMSDDGGERRSMSLDLQSDTSMWRPSIELLDRGSREEYELALEAGQTASDEGHGKKSGIFGTSANFTNSILGVGIVGMPYALKESGLISGVILLVVMACVTDWSIGLLIRTSHMCSARTYPALCQKAFGVVGRIATAFFMWFLTFVGSVGYTIIVGDSLPAVMEFFMSHLTHNTGTWWYQLLINRTFWIIMAVVFVIGPLSMLDNISKLEKFSFLSIVSEITLLGVVIAEAIIIFVRVKSGNPEPEDITSLPSSFSSLFLSKNVFGAIGVFSMAFSAHHNSHLLYGAMKNASPQRFRYSTHMSMFASAFVLLILAVMGFLSFQNNTRGNILTNLPGSSIQGNIARFAITLTMFFTMPLEMFVCKTAASDLLKTTILRKASLPERSFIKEVHLVRLLTVFMLALITGIAILVKDLGSVLELAGGFAAVSLAYVLPSLCYLKLAPERWYSRQKLPALLLCIVGVFCFLTSTPFNLYRLITGAE